MRHAIPRITHLRLLVAPPIRRQLATSKFSKIFGEYKNFAFQDRLREKLFRPGTQTTAEEEEEKRAPEIAPGYVEAHDGRELRVVGLDPGPEEWDVPAFITNPKLENPASIVRAVHRAVVEVYTTSLNGIPASEYTPLYTGPESLTEVVSIRVSPNGEATFDYSDPNVEQGILATQKADPDAEIRPYGEEEMYSEGVPEWVGEGLEKTGWTKLGLRKDAKFAVIRRVVQLTGIKIPDPEVTKMKTVAHLLEHLEYKPKPKKLFEVLAESDLPSIPNVKVFASRVRPWDKERMIGRERPFEKAVEFKYPFEVQSGKS